jgi:multidrug efflux pump subunit AcrA (membrane-fusion protein)
MARSTQFFGIQITLATSTATNLLTKLQVVDTNVPAMVHALQIQADVAVPGTLLVGDAAISSSRYGQSLVSAAGPPVKQDTMIFGGGGGMMTVPLGAVYLLSTSAMKVNVVGWID